MGRQIADGGEVAAVAARARRNLASRRRHLAQQLGARGARRLVPPEQPVPRDARRLARRLVGDAALEEPGDEVGRTPLEGGALRGARLAHTLVCARGIPRRFRLHARVQPEPAWDWQRQPADEVHDGQLG
eukprot:3551117-Prymnesium_polylepis.3